MDLLNNIKKVLPADTVNTHDLAAVRFAFRIVERADYYHKSRFGSAQYSDSYAQWITKSYSEDPEFFRKARDKFRVHRSTRGLAAG